jgi:predicted DNA-binding protein
LTGCETSSVIRLTIALTVRLTALRLTDMEVHFKPGTESRLHELASQSGRPTDDLVEDAMAAYLVEVAEVRTLLDSRYDDIKSGREKPVDGEAFFESLRQREDDLIKQRSSK